MLEVSALDVLVEELRRESGVGSLSGGEMPGLTVRNLVKLVPGWRGGTHLPRSRHQVYISSLDTAIGPELDQEHQPLVKFPSRAAR
jgi:hypothetical protein